MKETFVAIPRVPQSGYLRHNAFSADIVGRRDEQQPECRHRGTDRTKTEQTRGIGAKLRHLPSVEII
jgi:hypothetical protein